MRKMIQNYKVPLSDEIAQSYDQLIDVVDTVSEELFYKKITEGTGGAVSVADIIAYQIGWGKLLIGWYKAGVAKKTVVMPGEGFVTWDYVGLANHFSEKYRYTDKATTLEAFYKVVEEIIAFVKLEQKTNNLTRLGIWDWCTIGSGKQWPLSKWVQVNTVAPYKRARVMVKKIIAEGNQ